MGEGITEEAGDAADDVDARVAELGERDDLEADDASALHLPARPHAEQRQYLCDVVALRAHRTRAPDRDTDGVGVATFLAQEAIEHAGSEQLTGLPGGGTRHDARVDG